MASKNLEIARNWLSSELDSFLGTPSKKGKTGKTEGKASRFSLLHIGGEACATFEAIYLSNKINPKYAL